MPRKFNIGDRVVMTKKGAEYLGEDDLHEGSEGSVMGWEGANYGVRFDDHQGYYDETDDDGNVELDFHYVGHVSHIEHLFKPVSEDDVEAAIRSILGVPSG